MWVGIKSILTTIKLYWNLTLFFLLFSLFMELTSSVQSCASNIPLFFLLRNNRLTSDLFFFCYLDKVTAIAFHVNCWKKTLRERWDHRRANQSNFLTYKLHYFWQTFNTLFTTLSNFNIKNSLSYKVQPQLSLVLNHH